MKVKLQEFVSLIDIRSYLIFLALIYWQGGCTRGGSRHGPIRPCPPPFWQVNHANSACFGAISAKFPPILTLGPLFLQILDPALDVQYFESNMMNRGRWLWCWDTSWKHKFFFFIDLSPATQVQAQTLNSSDIASTPLNSMHCTEA